MITSEDIQKENLKIITETIEKMKADYDNYLEILRLRITRIESDLKEVRIKARNIELHNEECHPEKEKSREGLNFGEALQWMRKGFKVGKWHRTNVHIWLCEPDEMTKQIFMVRTIEGQVTVWCPNHDELLSCDWKVIE